MSQGKPKIYEAEFRESAVKLANETSQSIVQTARNMGINEKTLLTWISKYSRPVESVKAVCIDEHFYRELKRLKKEIARAEERNRLLVPLCAVGILGKKGGSVFMPFGYFTKEHQPTFVDAGHQQ
jgi:transposase